MENKRFDKSLHQEYDEIGRRIVKDFMKRKFSFKVLDNPDEYGVDLHIYHDNTLVGYAEVEVRNSWKGLTFPFEDVNIPHRKRKLLENDLPTLFFSVNNDGTALLCCGAMTVLNSPIKESRNKYMKENEFFFKVPLAKMTYYRL